MSKHEQKYKLICLDVDGVLVEGRDFWMDAHKAFGTYDQGKALTKKYLHNDYQKLVEEVVHKLWKGKDATPFLELVKNRKYMKGIKDLFELIKKSGWVSAIVSGSSFAVAKRVKGDFGVDYIFANELVIKGGKVQGYNARTEAGKDKKADIIKELCKNLGIDLNEVVYIGDTDVDIEAFKIVGKAIAFNAESKELKEQADVVVEGDDLKDVVPHLES